MRTHLVFLLAAAAALAPAAARAQISVLSSTVQEHTLQPGGSHAGTIVVQNTTAEPQEVRAYLADYRFHADGRTEYGEAGSAPRSNAGWITLSPARVTVPPRGQARIDYRVAVPAAGAALTGSHWSMVMVEPIARGSAESAHRPAPGARATVGVETRVRFGVQVATQLGETGTRRVEFTGTHAVAAAGGSRVLQFDLLNSGEVAYRPALRVELYDAQGNAAGTFAAERGLLYPGTSLRQRFDLGRLPAGAYQALVIADAGGESVFGAKYQLQL